jgi:hypothetical protein
MSYIANIFRAIIGKPSIVHVPVQIDRVSGSEAAAILAWSFREMFKYRQLPDPLSPMNELGWWLSQDLSSNAHNAGAHQSFLDDPLDKQGGSNSHSVYKCAPLVELIADPVITTLWEIGTLRALSDLLAHLVLRTEEPGMLRWNTADYVKAEHGIDLYAINDAYKAQRRAAKAASHT